MMIYNNSTDNSTPQILPSVDLFGNKINSNIIFFKLPKQIGEIIGVYSNFIEGDEPLTKQKKQKKLILRFLIGVLIYLVIYILFRPMIIWDIIWFFIISLIVYIINNSLNDFSRTNLYVGTRGFAAYNINEEKDINGVEMQFKDMIDLYIKFTDIVRNFHYEKTKYEFTFYNYDKKVYTYSDSYNKKKKDTITLNFLKKIEQSYSTFLINQIETEIKRTGYILFRIRKSGDLYNYMKLSIGSITFFNGNEEFTYKHDDIKSMYISGTDLFIEHKNYKRKFFILETGNSNFIPLLDLCNKQFFFEALKILLGFDLT